MIVGIGASAGGLDAFKAFFSRLPANSHLAFVLVQHLAPDHSSMLAELLSRCTDMPVVEAGDGMRVEGDHVYVIPPDATLTIAKGVLKVSTPAPPREHRRPIDTFLASLAEDQGDCAVGIILSGTGSDGTQGIRAIKDHGGLTLAQSASGGDAALTGMPANAAATGLVDTVLPVEDMPARLASYQKQMLDAWNKKGPDGVRQDLGDGLPTICRLLFAETGHDFSQYKEKTLMRRIQRRMLVAQVETESEYIEYLQQHPEEYRLLFHEFLIGVTEFFRDPEALDTLHDVAIPALLADKDASDHLRIWIPGCATGEEVYSIAMLVCEALPAHRGPKVQIFATDIDERAIAVARTGHYRRPLNGVSQERQDRWFTEENGGYRVIKQIRDMCIFSVHNVISDPPFSRMDLVSCRNLLIYLNADLQRQLMQSFHYALREGGFLLLGSSERLASESKLFKVMDKKQRLYARNSHARTHPRDLSSVQRPSNNHGGHASSLPQGDNGDSIDRQARHIMEPYSPAYVVINTKHEVLRFHGDTGHYLSPSPGAASLNLFQLLGRPLRATVREMAMEVFASGRGMMRQGPDFPRNGRDRPLRLIVEPLFGEGGNIDMCMVAFIELEFAPQAIESSTDVKPGTEAARIRQLEGELQTTRAQLNTAIAMHERTSEELKSANEEYQSVNEELQSANEELETSTEEMQSINEELQTVNAELHSKNEELSRVNDDITNLLNSTHIAALFLEKDMTIRNFTPAMTEVFHLREGDKGRPLPEISSRIDYPELQADAARVLEEMEVTERVLPSLEGGKVYLMRMRPYVTINDGVDGVVLTFVDITESQRQDQNARLAAIVNSSRDAIFGFSRDDRINSWNPSAERIFGLTPEEAVGRPLQCLCPDDAPDEVKAFFDQDVREQRLSPFEMTWVRPDGKAVPLEMAYSPVRDRDGKRMAGKIIARDITERREAERHTRMILDELNHRVKNTLASVLAIAEQTLANASDLQDFRDSFLSRVLALSQTHNLLARDAWLGVALPVIVHNELAPYQHGQSRRVVLEGGDITLTPKQALALSMAIHELATNAGKYGSLSVPEGQVVVKWDTRMVGEQRRLCLHWTETGGPAVAPPRRKGFGSRLIRDGLAYELDGNVELQFPPDGVTCTIDIPLDT